MILVYIAYLLAGNFLINGLFHFMMGLLGKKFVRRPKSVTPAQYEKVYCGKLFSSAVFNALYGLAQIIAVLLVLLLVGSFRFGLTAGTGSLFAGIVLGTVTIAWKYEGTLS
jgi:hypothetical protein